MKEPKISTRAIILIALFALSACSRPGDENREVTQEDWSNSVAITGAILITMDGNEVLSDHTVLIRDGKVADIFQGTEVPEGVEIIDGKGKYLVPGLAEMHAHIPVPRDGDRELVDETLFLYLSNGVTTIRGMLGNPFHLELRQQAAEEKILSPRIYTSGPSLNGNSAPDPATGAAMVRDQASKGYDFLKLHPGLSRETFDEIDRVADSAGIPFAGHVSIDVGIRRALEAGYGSIDHVDGYVEGLVPESINVDPASNGFFGYNFTDIADPLIISELVGLTAENEVWVVPTQCLLERWSGPVDPEEIIKDPEMKYMSEATRRNWVSRVKEYQSAEGFDLEKANRFIELRRRILKAMHDSGVMLILGSDAPQIFNVPGFSIQHELESMVNLGLSPREALVTGTVNPAIYFGQQGEFGQIVKGASADLILLDRDPLEDISNMRDPAGVMVRGKWISRDHIQKRLSEIAEKYTGPVQ